MIKEPLLPYFDEACRLWQQGDVVAIPTETVYGLAADAANDQGVSKIFSLKNRPSFNPLIVHVADLSTVERYTPLSPLLLKVADSFWPGPLTVVVTCRERAPLSPFVTAGLETVAIRIPQHPITQALLRSYGKALAAPSANKSTQISPTSAEDVERAFGRQVPLIIDGGSSSIGLESTILDLTLKIPTLLRPGGVTLEDLREILGDVCSTPSPKEGIKAPGMLKRHYAPCLPLRLNALDKKAGESLLGFGDTLCDLNLSERGDLREAAANLFKMMRLLDTPPYQGIAVSPIPFQGVGIAINDRLNRAATREKENDI